MKFYLLALVLCIGAVVAEENVLDLDIDTFDDAIKNNELIMVEFYAPWCGHCKSLAPEYEKAATELKDTPLKLAKVNADDEKNRPLATKYGVRGFPTLKFFRGTGEPKDYQGERKADALVAFMKKQALPAVSELKTVEEVEKFSGNDRVVVIGFFKSADSDEAKTFASVAEKMRDNFMFGAVNGQDEVAKKFEVEAPNVILFKKFDEGKNVLGASFDMLEEFVNKYSVPLIDEIGPNNYKTYVESGKPLAYLFVDLTVDGQMEEFTGKVKDLAKDTKAKMNWVYIDWAKYAKHSERLGLSGTKVPALAIEHDGAHFAFDEATDLTTESVSTWVNAYLDGKVDPTIKSEEIPESNDGPVKVVVAKQFDELVMDKSKDVLMEFYAPWCGHCKSLAPIYEKLGEQLKGVESVVVAKMDATANDVDPKYGVRGFPTLKLFKSGENEVVDYNGDRTLEDLAKFIHENAGTKFDLPAVKDDESSGKDEL